MDDLAYHARQIVAAAVDQGYDGAEGLKLIMLILRMASIDQNPAASRFRSIRYNTVSFLKLDAIRSFLMLSGFIETKEGRLRCPEIHVSRLRAATLALSREIELLQKRNRRESGNQPCVVCSNEANPSFFLIDELLGFVFCSCRRLVRCGTSIRTSNSTLLNTLTPTFLIASCLWQRINGQQHETTSIGVGRSRFYHSHFSYLGLNSEQLTNFQPWRHGTTDEVIRERDIIEREESSKRTVEFEDKFFEDKEGHAALVHSCGIRVDYLLAITFALNLWEWRTWVQLYIY